VTNEPTGRSDLARFDALFTDHQRPILAYAMRRTATLADAEDVTAETIMYDRALLPTFDVVFDGTVTGIEGDRVTFQVETGWKGVDGGVTLTVPGTSIALTGPMPDFEVGGRYLVTAAGGNVNGCGYTLAYDAATAATWAAAFAN